MFLAFSQSEVERRKACERVVNVHLFFFIRIVVFPAQAENSYFSADFKRGSHMPAT